jgi:hypothetical protein
VRSPSTCNYFTPPRVMQLIERLAFYYDLNDCADKEDDDALEVPITDLRIAREIWDTRPQPGGTKPLYVITYDDGSKCVTRIKPDAKDTDVLAVKEIICE